MIKQSTTKSSLALAFPALFSFSVHAEDSAPKEAQVAEDQLVGLVEEKNPEDPTKVITRLGVGYQNDMATISGSLGLDETRMLNASINQDASSWSIGGSWLFDAGILNVSIRNSTYDDDSHNTAYNIGTFIPLSYFGFKPFGIQSFVTTGYSYGDGKVMRGVEPPEGSLPENPVELVATPHTTHGVYLGSFNIKPLAKNLTGMFFAGTTQGTDDLSAYWGGAGVSYKVNKNHSFNTFGILSDSSIYGSDNSMSFNYRYEL